ncbi:NB-ARC domain-containing protein [Pantanalinema rosaneae CENA516]|uniref:NB-ARC domain-containing protein n=1 Tax=Pantanalinema rosaneae TaxID=1620701 RepID=UPI003D6E8806
MENTLKASEQGLAIVDQARKRKGWNRQSIAWSQLALTTVSCLKQFWRGERIQRDTFIRLCQVVGIPDWQTIADLPTDGLAVELAIPEPDAALPYMQDWGEAPEPAFFCGRRLELQTLWDWMGQERCKLVALLGMGGIGKTTLSVQLVEQLLDPVVAAAPHPTSSGFQAMVWRSLRNAPPLEGLLADVIPSLSRQSSVILPDRLDLQVALLLHCLREQRCLLVLDNLESILQESSHPATLAAGVGDASGRYRAGYENYGELLRRLGEERHQSCVFLTSRELPPEVALLESERVRVLRLTGLTIAEGHQVLQRTGMLPLSEPQCAAIVSHYAGNPLALKIVAAGIRGLLNNDVVQFLDLLQQGKFTFSDIHDLLERHFNRLSGLEQEVMYWLAIERQPITINTLQADLLLPDSYTKLPETLSSLNRRSLLEVTATGYTLQPVVMEYTTNRLIQQIEQELLTQEPNLFNRHALLKAQSQDYIREAQTCFILEPLVQRLQMAYRDQESLVCHLTQLLDQHRGQPVRQTGYLAGNLLNLCSYLQVDLSGYDCSHLPIWQANLRGVSLNQVNFSHADLSTSAFTETFGSVVSLAFSPDGTILATSDNQGWFYLWQISTGQQLRAVHAHQDWIFSIAFHPTGDCLITGSLDCSLKVWQVASGDCLRTIQVHRGGVATVAFSPDGQWLASGSSDRTITLMHSQTGKLRHTLTGHTDIIRAIAWYPDSRRLASVGFDHTIKIWDVTTGACWRTWQDTCALLTIAVIPQPADRILLATGGDDGRVKLWDGETGECLAHLNHHQATVWSLAVSPDGQTLASAGDDPYICLWDLISYQVSRTLQGHQGRIWTIAYTPAVTDPDRMVLASGSEDKMLRFWHPEDGHCLRTLQGYHNATFPIGFLPLSIVPAPGQLLTLSDDHQIRCWDLTTGDCLKPCSFAIPGAMQAALSPNGCLLASAGLDNTVKLWQLEQRKCLATLWGHTAWVRAVVFSPAGEWLASASGDQTIRLWQVETGDCLAVLEGHTNPVQALCFSPDGRTIASSSWDQTIKLWQVETGSCLHTFIGHTNRLTAATFSPDGQVLISASQDQTIRFWQVQTGVCFRVLTAHQAGVVSIALHPQGELLVSASLDGTVRCWSVSRGECLWQIPLRISYNNTVLFSPDGGWLSIGSQDGFCLLVDGHTGECHVSLQVLRPYEGMILTGATGLTDAQWLTLKRLGAIE